MFTAMQAPAVAPGLVVYVRMAILCSKARLNYEEFSPVPPSSGVFQGGQTTRLPRKLGDRIFRARTMGNRKT